ncbi:MAG: SpoVR family protein [Acidobacteria bacterium]|nr:SpoVR family protein [Acidobacteriota bacterium]
MRTLRSDPELFELEARVQFHAKQFGRTLPEMRFFILNAHEFMALLEKKVYPTSPTNIWEGKRMVTRKFRVESGQESALYYEVVQTGNPSYAYLNHTNNAMTQASVMAHVVGHCEFSELNVLRDSTRDRTERVMHLVRKVELGQQQMGEQNYRQYWNALESATTLMAPNSQYNFENSVDTEILIERRHPVEEAEPELATSVLQPYSSTLEALLRPMPTRHVVEEDLKTRLRQEALSRRGYKLRAPCQDVLAFLRAFAPASRAEKAMLDYFYIVHAPQDFVIRTQIMNEGWAMYWEKKIMLELFKERAVTGIVDYAKTFSGVCYPRPYYARNPYHLGFHMWNHIEELYRSGKVSLDFLEEKDQANKMQWDKPSNRDPIEAMGHLVRTVTDYEFLRRFLTPQLIHQFHLNRIPQRDAARFGISKKDVIQEDRFYVWVDPEPIKDEMLRFFTHFYRPRIYLIDTDFEDGGLLLYHRDDGRRLKLDWIRPTLKNLNMIWKGAIYLASRGTLYGFTGGRYKEMRVGEITFERVLERIMQGKKPMEIA